MNAPVDKYGRRFKSLRVSLTAACNFACNYCVADDKLQRAKDECSGSELCGLVSLLHEILGFDKIRLTGGEPLVARSFEEVLAFVSKMPVEISLTTNAQLIHKYKNVFQNSKLHRVNISLDSLDDHRFKLMARAGDLPTVLNNIEWLLAQGIKLKMNMVPMRGYNEKDIVPLLNYCLERGIELRYIELMRMGHMYDMTLFNKHFIPMAEILELIRKETKYNPMPRLPNSTSVRYRTSKGIFAFVPNESKPFCGDCDRLRLTSNGKLFGCISNASNESIVETLQMPHAEATSYLSAKLGLVLKHKQNVFSGQLTSMKALGG